MRLVYGGGSEGGKKWWQSGHTHVKFFIKEKLLIGALGDQACSPHGSPLGRPTLACQSLGTHTWGSVWFPAGVSGNKKAVSSAPHIHLCTHQHKSPVHPGSERSPPGPRPLLDPLTQSHPSARGSWAPRGRASTAGTGSTTKQGTEGETAHACPALPGEGSCSHVPAGQPDPGRRGGRLCHFWLRPKGTFLFLLSKLPGLGPNVHLLAASVFREAAGWAWDLRFLTSCHLKLQRQSLRGRIWQNCNNNCSPPVCV